MQLSEVGGELAEERAAAALASERADAEAAERLRVERDNRELLANNQRLQQVGDTNRIIRYIYHISLRCTDKLPYHVFWDKYIYSQYYSLFLSNMDMEIN